MLFGPPQPPRQLRGFAYVRALAGGVSVRTYWPAMKAGAILTVPTVSQSVSASSAGWTIWLPAYVQWVPLVFSASSTVSSRVSSRVACPPWFRYSTVVFV